MAETFCTRKELPQKDGQAYSFCCIEVGCFSSLENSTSFDLVILETKANKQDKTEDSKKIVLSLKLICFCWSLSNILSFAGFQNFIVEFRYLNSVLDF